MLIIEVLNDKYCRSAKPVLEELLFGFKEVVFLFTYELVHTQLFFKFVVAEV